MVDARRTTTIRHEDRSMTFKLLTGAALTALALAFGAQGASAAIEPAKKSFHFGIYAPVVPYYAPHYYAPTPGPQCFDYRYYPFHGCF
jgi:hypothetical protein